MVPICGSVPKRGTEEPHRTRLTLRFRRVGRCDGAQLDGSVVVPDTWEPIGDCGLHRGRGCGTRAGEIRNPTGHLGRHIEDLVVAWPRTALAGLRSAQPIFGSSLRFNFKRSTREIEVAMTA